MLAPRLVILLGVLSTSSSAILFRLAAADPLAAAFYRLAFATAILLLTVLGGRWSAVGRRELALSALSGVCLAVHFGAWFFSLTMTSIASSTILVSTHPFLVLLGAYLLWGETPRREAFAGLALAVLGTVLIGWGDFAAGQAAVFGDLLALLGAVAVAGYFLIGRTVRTHIGAIQYSAIAYGSAALVLLGGAIVADSSLSGYPPSTWWALLGLAVFPTIFGHTLFNWALKYVSPGLVSVSVLGEPVGATLLAALIWQEWPGPLVLLGGVILLVGIGLFQRFTVSQ